MNEQQQQTRDDDEDIYNQRRANGFEKPPKIELNFGALTEMSAEEFKKIFDQTGYMYYDQIDITGDSAEYELITEGIALSWGIEGMAIELGLRRGMGTKYIIDAVRNYCPDKCVVAIDPYGSVLYTCREPDGPVRLDYDNSMKSSCLKNIWAYIDENPVRFQFFNCTDTVFFRKYADGVEWYDLDERIETKYSFAHLDANHTVSEITKEMLWFYERMDVGAIVCIDDCTPDFFCIEDVEVNIKGKFECVRIGAKKRLYKRI